MLLLEAHLEFHGVQIQVVCRSLKLRSLLRSGILLGLEWISSDGIRFRYSMKILFSLFNRFTTSSSRTFPVSMQRGTASSALVDAVLCRERSLLPRARTNGLISSICRQDA